MKDFIRQIKINEDCSLEEAVSILCIHNVNGIGVCDLNNKLVGFISAKDLLKRIFAQKYHNVPSGRVKDYLTKEVISVNESSSIHDLISKFIDFKYPLLFKVFVSLKTISLFLSTLFFSIDRVSIILSKE